MRFTHLDILEQCFHDKFRGYSKHEVDTFLQLVADDFKEMSEEIELLKKESDKSSLHISKLEEQLKKLKSNIGKINEKRLITEELSNIHHKAQNILLQAQEQANSKRKLAEKELNRIREEIKLLKGEKESLLENFKAGAKSYLESLYKKKPDHAASD